MVDECFILGLEFTPTRNSIFDSYAKYPIQWKIKFTLKISGDPIGEESNIIHATTGLDDNKLESRTPALFLNADELKVGLFINLCLFSFTKPCQITILMR